MTIKVAFKDTSQIFNVGFSESEQNFKVGFDESVNVTNYGAEVYQGDYVITPKTKEQKMQTKNKMMGDDVVIKSIPFFNVSNTSGGTTVYIGSEV